MPVALVVCVSADKNRRKAVRLERVRNDRSKDVYKRQTLIDTGGIEPKTDDTMLVYMRAQAEAAIETADVIIFMVDVTAGVTANDRDVATMLIKSRKPIVLCVKDVYKRQVYPL